MFSVDAMARQPVYEQLIEQMERYLLTGGLKPGQQLPSVRSLSVTLSVNPNTIQKAYAELERRGLLTAVPGRGCFVTDDAAFLLSRRKRERLGELEALAYELALAGIPEAESREAVAGAYRRVMERFGYREMSGKENQTP